ncbi:hypothetical protein BDW59DRAFT_158177 [Aspergillus cavernicola]|uniref:Tim44-like domain-containing protein n=1 Tax=Aspergillus cavernicola TaxID=176166 RepID=A0ABR4ITY5_9EURO
MASLIPKGPLLSVSRPHPTGLSLNLATASSQCRQFSLSSQRSVLQRMPETLSVRQPAQPSMKSKGKALPRSELPQDIGVLPGTFIRPLWRDLPSIFQQPKERLRFEWLWVKSGVQNFGSLFLYCKIQVKGLPLRLRERRQVAREFHKRMYSAFADGDAATLRKICCTGLANNLIGRVASRPKGEKVTWSLDKYLRSPSTFFTGIRVVSDRATQIPELPDSGVRQVVLRITSRQSTGKAQRQLAGDNAPTEKSPAKQQDCTEYIVLQKLRWLGEEEGWRVWGHTMPTTIEDLENPFFAAGIPLAERLEAMKEIMGAKK